VQELTRLSQDPEMCRRVNGLNVDKCGLPHHGYVLNTKGANPAGNLNAVLDAGGSVDLKNDTQETLLQMAVIYSQVEVVRLY